MSNGARTIIVESPDRFARDLMVQLAGHDMLKARGVTLIAASAPMHFVEDTPTAVLVRQVLGAVAEFEKTTLVAKLAAARRRKRMATGKKVEGRKSHAEARPDVVSAGEGARSQEAQGREAEPAGHVGGTGRSRLPQRARASRSTPRASQSYWLADGGHFRSGCSGCGQSGGRRTSGYVFASHSRAASVPFSFAGASGCPRADRVEQDVRRRSRRRGIGDRRDQLIRLVRIAGAIQ